MKLPPGLLFAVALMWVAMLSMSQLTHFSRQAYPFLGLFSLAFVAYLLALCFSRQARLELWFILLVALCLRVPLWATTPSLSSDVWRYLWDGRLLTHGLSPYAERVDSPELADLRTDLHARIDHQWMASPYPPAAQAVFGFSYAIAPESPRAMQIAFTLFDLAAVALLAQLLKAQGRPAKWSIIYAWHPLSVVEFAHGAHVDSLMCFLILAAIWAVQKRHFRLSAACLALATLTKFIPLLLLPVFLRRWPWRVSLFYGVLLGAAFGPFIWMDGLAQEGTGVFGAAQIYAQEWQTNAGLLHWGGELLQAHSNDPLSLARLISQGLLVILGAFFFWRPGRDIYPPLALLISAYLLLAFAMFPWYLAWLLILLPLLPLRPPWMLFGAAWLYFSWAVNLSYLFYLDPAHPVEADWIRQAEYLPLYLGLGLAAMLAIGPLLKGFLPGQAQEHPPAQGQEARIKADGIMPRQDS
jgi:hypothetical protein